MELATTRGGQGAAPTEAAPVVEPAAGGEWWEGHTRVAGSRRPLVVVPPLTVSSRDRGPGDPEDEAPLVPVPGRHAARRRRPGLTDALPDTLRGRVGLGVGQVAVLAVVVAVGLALTTWWVLRGDPEVAPAAAPVVTPSGSAIVALPSPSASPPEVGGAAPATTVTVDVAGKVRRPGIAVLDPGSRVVDALEAAGGARPGVDLSSINLARVVVDGEQILVGRPATAPAVPGLTAGAPPGAAGPLVNLNLAGQAELETLPEVGPVTAQAILAWRDEHGGFSSVEELLEVDGIGDVTLERIAPFVTI